jgi:D-arabinose 1-dehydrogenase-like Zn-dependent alcohol dehydrogenase
MPRAIVFHGDETWEQREFPVPALRPGCAVLRVEAVGICHSDVDQFRGRPPVPSGGVFPVVPAFARATASACARCTGSARPAP